MPVSVATRPAPAKAMAVSDNRSACPTGPGRGTRGQYPLQTSSNRSNLEHLVRTPVTNVVNLRPKTTIFSEKAVGLTTFVTTHKRSARNRSARGPCDAHGLRRGFAAVPVGNGVAWPRCPWAVAGPGRALRRRAKPHISNQAPLVWRAPEGLVGLAAVPVGGGGSWSGFKPTRRTKHQRPGPTGVKGPGGIGGPGCGARGRRRGQGGPRDRSLRAAGSRVAISRAGRRPRAHHAARPVNAYKNAHPEPGGRI